VWSTDANGNYLSNILGVVSGNSLALETIETTFNQDLNGDGTSGPTTVVIQTDGTTALTQIANTYSLYTNGSGPSLKYSGAVVTAGEFAGWTPIGAVQVAGGGYDVALKNTATGQYTVWSTDSSGNYASNLIGLVSETSTALESLETTFNQDLNSDGTIGIPKVVIQTDGSTSLVQVGSNYFLNGTGSGTGPELQYNGAAVTVGEFSGWSLIGAVQVAGGGYDVAWHDTGSGQYTVWSVDSNGNYLSNLIPIVSATSTALEALENTFQQDLNGDGIVGIYAAPATTLQVNNPLSGPSGSATIGAGATLELAAANASSVTFAGSTGMLKLDSPSTFDGVIYNFTGNGTLSGSDQIDLKGINFNSVSDSYSNGVLTVTDGKNSAALDFNGAFTLANFKFASDGSGGTILYDPPVSAGQSVPAEIMHDPAVAALDQQLALFSQHMASAFPSSALGNDGASTGATELAGAQSQIAQPVTSHPHA
jgi:serralysin